MYGDQTPILRSSIPYPSHYTSKKRIEHYKHKNSFPFVVPTEHTPTVCIAPCSKARILSMEVVHYIACKSPCAQGQAAIINNNHNFQVPRIQLSILCRSLSNTEIILHITRITYCALCEVSEPRKGLGRSKIMTFLSEFN